MLIEEPENHLSYLSMHRLIDKIEEEKEKQTFIATHNNMIATRLNLKNIIFLGGSSCVRLDELPDQTAKFFEKAPENNALNFILAEKNILVEGSAEYILIENFFAHITKMKMHESGVGIISCGGKNFKNYLELSKVLKKKTAVITDNDSDYKKNVEQNYKEYIGDYIQVFADVQDSFSTFEIVLYENNKQFYKKYIESKKMSKGVQEFMLNNKAEAALRLLSKLEEKPELYKDFQVPSYIEDAVKWISE